MSKKTYLIILILFLILVVAVFFVGRGNKAEAPTVQTDSAVTPSMGDNTAPVENQIVTGEPVIKGGVKEFTISGQNFSFTPNMISVKKGDKVRIIFENTMGFHDFKIDEYGVSTKQAKAPYQEIVEFTANKVGSFEYYCSVGTHRAMGMKGTLNVE